MSANDIGQSEKSSSALSVDAAEFVPTSVTHASSSRNQNQHGVRPLQTQSHKATGWKDRGGRDGGRAPNTRPRSHGTGSSHTADVPPPVPPPYMVNCYPFVPQNGSIRPSLSGLAPPYSLPPDMSLANGLVASPIQPPAAISLVGPHISPAHFAGLPSTDPALGGLHHHHHTHQHHHRQHPITTTTSTTTIVTTATNNNNNTNGPNTPHPSAGVHPNQTWLMPANHHHHHHPHGLQTVEPQQQQQTPPQPFLPTSHQHPPPRLQIPTQLRHRFNLRPQRHSPRHLNQNHNRHHQQHYYDDNLQHPPPPPPINNTHQPYTLNQNQLQYLPPNQYPNFSQPNHRMPPPPPPPQQPLSHLTTHQHQSHLHPSHQSPGEQTIHLNEASKAAMTSSSSSLSVPIVSTTSLAVPVSPMVTTSLSSSAISSSSSPSSPSSKPGSGTKVVKDSQKNPRKSTNHQGSDPFRPSSPVLISRSSQTDKIPHGVKDLTLLQKPHPLFLAGQSGSTNSNSCNPLENCDNKPSSSHGERLLPSSSSSSTSTSSSSSSSPACNDKDSSKARDAGLSADVKVVVVADINLDQRSGRVVSVEASPFDIDKYFTVAGWKTLTSTTARTTTTTTTTTTTSSSSAFKSTRAPTATTRTTSSSTLGLTTRSNNNNRNHDNSHAASSSTQHCLQPSSNINNNSSSNNSNSNKKQKNLQEKRVGDSSTSVTNITSPTTHPSHSYRQGQGYSTSSSTTSSYLSHASPSSSASASASASSNRTSVGSSGNSSTSRQDRGVRRAADKRKDNSNATKHSNVHVNDDDEKINLQSWTDFPPMMGAGGGGRGIMMGAGGGGRGIMMGASNAKGSNPMPEATSSVSQSQPPRTTMPSSSAVSSVSSPINGSGPVLIQRAQGGPPWSLKEQQHQLQQQQQQQQQQTLDRNKGQTKSKSKSTSGRSTATTITTSASSILSSSSSLSPSTTTTTTPTTSALSLSSSLSSSAPPLVKSYAKTTAAVRDGGLGEGGAWVKGSSSSVANQQSPTPTLTKEVPSSQDSPISHRVTSHGVKVGQHMDYPPLPSSSSTPLSSVDYHNHHHQNHQHHHQQMSHSAGAHTPPTSHDDQKSKSHRLPEQQQQQRLSDVNRYQSSPSSHPHNNASAGMKHPPTSPSAPSTSRSKSSSFTTATTRNKSKSPGREMRAGPGSAERRAFKSESISPARILQDGNGKNKNPPYNNDRFNKDVRDGSRSRSKSPGSLSKQSKPYRGLESGGSNNEMRLPSDEQNAWVVVGGKGHGRAGTDNEGVSERGGEGDEGEEDNEEEEEKSTTKRRRQRRRRRNHVRTKQGREGGEFVMNDGESDGIDGRETADGGRGDAMLHFEDTDEFPDLMSSVSRGHSQSQEAVIGGVGGDRSSFSGTSLSYSDLARNSWGKRDQSLSRTHSLTGSCVSEDNLDDASAETKRARKRRKRREQANKAAETELAEISLEQELLREGLKKTGGLHAGNRWKNQTSPGLISSPAVVREIKKGRGNPTSGGGKKSKQPIALDLAAMIEASKSKTSDQHPSPKSSVKGDSRSSSAKRGNSVMTVSSRPANPLDSTAPLQRRGKEREFPKAKKPSPLKKVILKEREAKKQMRLMDGKDLDDFGNPHGVGMVGVDSELSQDALSSKSEGTDQERQEGGSSSQQANLSADLSPISQTSPISMSPASPGNSGVNSPVSGSVGRDSVIQKIHSRRFREYCNQVLDKEIDQCCTDLLQDLVRFQDRLYHKDPMRAKRKRRVVLGLREVTKHLRLKKIKCVVISPNLEKIQSKGGLDEALNTILSMCQEQDVPFVFALGRRALGRACAKLVPVSVVGIFTYQNCEENYNRLISLTSHARSAYNEMVIAVEREVASASTFNSVPGLIPAHMGHSRTPSGCSAISFTSSVISEPHSEYYSSYADELRISDGNSRNNSQGQGYSPDLDDGNEADIEDFGADAGRRRRGGGVTGGGAGGIKGNNSVRFDDESNGGGAVSASGAGSDDDRIGGGGGYNGSNAIDSITGGSSSSNYNTNGNKLLTDSGNSTNINNNTNGNNNNNNSSNNSSSIVDGGSSSSGGGGGGTGGGGGGSKPIHNQHHNHHNHIHGHHRRQSSVSSLARIMEGIDDDKEEATATSATATTTPSIPLPLQPQPHPHSHATRLATSLSSSPSSSSLSSPTKIPPVSSAAVVCGSGSGGGGGGDRRGSKNDGSGGDMIGSDGGRGVCETNDVKDCVEGVLVCGSRESEKGVGSRGAVADPSCLVSGSKVSAQEVELSQGGGGGGGEGGEISQEGRVGKGLSEDLGVKKIERVDDDEEDDVDNVDDDDDDDDDVGEMDDEEDDDDEDVAVAAVASQRRGLRGHTRQKSMDKKERIENWLSAQSNLNMD